jgi:hypothetical protein
MTPQDVPGQLVTIESLFPWLGAVIPVKEPARRKPQTETEPLREAA